MRCAGTVMPNTSACDVNERTIARARANSGWSSTIANESTSSTTGAPLPDPNGVSTVTPNTSPLT